MYAYETPKASEAKSEPAKKSRGGTDPVANRILIGNRGFDDRGSDPLSLKQALMQNIGTEHYTSVSSEGSAVVQLKDTAEVLPPLGDAEKYARHHIIPDGTMKAFIETLINHSRESQSVLEILMKIIGATNMQYKAVWKTYTEDRIAQMGFFEQEAIEKKKPRAELEMDGMDTILQQYEEDNYVDLDSLVDETNIINMFQWLPGNLVIGRNNRVNDPKDNKDSHLDLEAFRIKKLFLNQGSTAEDEEELRMLETAMEKYINNPNDEDLEEVLKHIHLLTEFNPLFEATPDGIWDGPFL